MRLYDNEASARAIAERDHWHFCREILRRALEGWRDPWVAAHYYTYGLHPVKYRQALADREARQLWELHRARVTVAQSAPEPAHDPYRNTTTLPQVSRQTPESQQLPRVKERAA